MIGRIVSSNVLSHVLQTTRCIADRTCPDDSGPNLLVHGVEFLFVLALVAALRWTVRRVRRRRRSG